MYFPPSHSLTHSLTRLLVFLLYSIVLCVGVGKTCLLLQYANQTFTPNFISTIGIDFKIKHCVIDGSKVKLQIWDTAGQERFRTITTSYFRGAQGIMLVYDVTDRKTYENIKSWVSQIKMHADSNVNQILVANKCDLAERLVTYEEGEALAKQFGMKFVETSAKTNTNVEQAFIQIATEVKDRLSKQVNATGVSSNTSSRNMKLDNKGGGERLVANGCC